MSGWDDCGFGSAAMGDDGFGSGNPLAKGKVPAAKKGAVAKAAAAPPPPPALDANALYQVTARPFPASVHRVNRRRGSLPDD